MWSKYEACVNCGTTERPHRGLGYCNRCYGPGKQFREVMAWDQSKPETLSRYPGQVDLDSPQDFELLREGYLQELKQRLNTLRRWEQAVEDSVDGLQIEFQLGRIANYAGTKTHGLYHGSASYIDSQFKPEQRKVLHSLLQRIEIDRPWRGVNLTCVFDYRQKRREERPEIAESDRDK